MTDRRSSLRPPGGGRRSGPVAAVRIPLPPGPPVDPFGLAGATGLVFQSADRVMVGLGRALTLPLPGGLEDTAGVEALTDVLASVACEDRVGDGARGVIAFGSLPFDPRAPGELVVPEVLYAVESDGLEWVCLLAGRRPTGPDAPAALRAWLVDRSLAARAAAAPGGGPGARRPTITPRTSDASFESMVAEAVRAVASRDVAKVVVSRQVDVSMGEPVDVAALLDRWHRLEPTCSVFSIPTPDGQLVGASPELLVERTGRRVRSRPLAGTTDRGDRDDGSDGVLPRELLDSTKDAAEHRMVVEAIGMALAPLCAELHVPERPDLVHLHNLTHLGTPLTGTLARREDGSTPTALELVAALHPTPAVGGVPRDRALALIARLEPEGRGHYAGPVGYVDAGGDGCWMLGIRAVTVAGSDARLAAGVGVVRGSDPRTERVETMLKLTAAFDALAPGVPFSIERRSSEHQTVG